MYGEEFVDLLRIGDAAASDELSILQRPQEGGQPRNYLNDLRGKIRYRTIKSEFSRPS
jgi:hypothetical protein